MRCLVLCTFLLLSPHSFFAQTNKDILSTKIDLRNFDKMSIPPELLFKGEIFAHTSQTLLADHFRRFVTVTYWDPRGGNEDEEPEGHNDVSIVSYLP